MGNREPQNAECIECRESIKPKAKKCIKCNSYQDWRRYLYQYQYLLAIGISLVALTAAFTNAGRETLQFVSSFFSKDSDEISAFITSISNGAGEIYVRNNSNSAIIVTGFSCAIFLPISNAELARHFLERRQANRDENSADGNLFSGPYFLNYRLMDSIVLQPDFEIAVAGFIESSIIGSNEPPDILNDDSAGCFLGAADESGESVGAVLPLSLRSMANFRADEVLNNTEFVGFSDESIEEIKRFHLVD